MALLGVAALAIFGRQLVFATVDPDVAEARGVRVRRISIAFLVVLALAVAITVQSADLRVTKVVNNATPNEGKAITYTVTVSHF